MLNQIMSCFRNRSLILKILLYFDPGISNIIPKLITLKLKNITSQLSLLSSDIWETEFSFVQDFQSGYFCLDYFFTVGCDLFFCRRLLRLRMTVIVIAMTMKMMFKSPQEILKQELHSLGKLFGNTNWEKVSRLYLVIN